MPKPQFTTVEEYIAAQPQAMQRELKRIRECLRKAVPGAAEVIAYNIPTFKLRGRTVLHFAGWKNFVSVYPANSRVIAEFGDEIKPYLAEKSTLRFPLEEAVPLELIELIAKFRAEEIEASHPSTGTIP
jgi:uncharacterized protein YdhG (YjbR/CyaY superfamily)